MDESWDLDKILCLFEAELLTRERVTSGSVIPKRKVPECLPPTASTLVTPSALNFVYYCQDHSSVSCITVPTVEAWKRSLRQAGRCYICLHQNHISCSCCSSLRCSRCKGKHHRSQHMPPIRSTQVQDGSTSSESNHSNPSP